MSGNGERIVALDGERMQAMANKEIGRLNELLCNGLVYTHSSARIDTKQSLLDGMTSGATVYTSVTPSEVVAQDLGDAVVLTGIARINVSLNGTPNEFGVRFTDVYQNQGGSWRMVAWQSTRLADPR